MKTLASLLVAGLLAFYSASAVEKAAPAGGHQLKEFKIGTHLSGPEVSDAAMQGKPVMLDCWGVNCGPCLALLPEIEKMSKRYKDKLVVVGAECQNSPAGAIDAIVKKNKLTYAITANVSSPVNFSGLPHVFLFDAKGEMVYNGSPLDKEFEHTLHKIVSAPGGATAAPVDVFGGLKKPGT